MQQPLSTALVLQQLVRDAKPMKTMFRTYQDISMYQSSSMHQSSNIGSKEIQPGQGAAPTASEPHLVSDTTRVNRHCPPSTESIQPCATRGMFKLAISTNHLRAVVVCWGWPERQLRCGSKSRRPSGSTLRRPLGGYPSSETRVYLLMAMIMSRIIIMLVWTVFQFPRCPSHYQCRLFRCRLQARQGTLRSGSPIGCKSLQQVRWEYPPPLHPARGIFRRS